MKKVLNKIKGGLINLYRRSYGNDELNKFLIIIGFGFLILSFIFKRNIILVVIAYAFLIIYFIRYFSTNKIKRIEENRKYRKLKKYYAMKWQYRKTHKIFMCKTCGQLIRVPKGKGKIETTCPSCNAKEIHRT